jgi:hypothetical protein
MEKKEIITAEKKLETVSAKPNFIMEKIYKGPRQVVYSYLNVKDLIKVMSLSKNERETIPNSKIIKENRKNIGFCLKIRTDDFPKYSSQVSLKGLLLAI